MAGSQPYDGGSGGLTLGNTTTALVGFYGTAGVGQAVAPTAPLGTAPSTTTPYGFTTYAQAAAVLAVCISTQLALKNLGLWA